MSSKKYKGHGYTWIEKRKVGEGYSGEVYLVQAESNPSLTGISRNHPKLQLKSLGKQLKSNKREISSIVKHFKVNQVGYEVRCMRFVRLLS